MPQAQTMYPFPSATELATIRKTWEKVSRLRLPGDDPNVSPSLAFGLAFYEAIFREDPELKKLFPNVMKQARALTGMISFITQPFDVKDLELAMRELGARHAFYGVKNEMFRVLGSAFITALQERLEDQYDAEIGRTWLKAYIFVTHYMKIGLESQLNWMEEREMVDRAPPKEHHHKCSIQ